MLSLLIPSVSFGAQVKLTVNAGNYDRTDCVVTANVSSLKLNAKSAVELCETTNPGCIETHEEAFKDADVLSLHCPLTDDTKHIINEQSLLMMKRDAVIINTGRGALIDTQALVNCLKKRTIGGAALDVYEEESKYFFDDWSIDVIRDDTLARLLTFPNVIITGHQAFLTSNALKAIANTTLGNIQAFMAGEDLENEVKK